MTAANNTPRLGNPPGEARLISLLPRVEKKREDSRGMETIEGNVRSFARISVSVERQFSLGVVEVVCCE